MDMISSCNIKITQFGTPNITDLSSLSLCMPSCSSHNFTFPFHNIPSRSYTVLAKKNKSSQSDSESVLKQTLVEDVLMEENEEEEVLFEDFEDGTSYAFALFPFFSLIFFFSCLVARKFCNVKFWLFEKS